MRKKKLAHKKRVPKKVSRRRVKKAAVTKKTAAAKKITRRKKPAKRKKPVRGKRTSASLTALEAKGLGAGSGGQSGDVQGLSNVAAADSESVEELLEEGQSFEAEVISGVEYDPDDDPEELTTREVPEDDVPAEYLEEDEE
jgi:hypothetical protein